MAAPPNAEDAGVPNRLDPVVLVVWPNRPPVAGCDVAPNAEMGRITMVITEAKKLGFSGDFQKKNL